VISRKSFDLPILGEPFSIMKAFTKRFPLGQYSQTVAEAAAQLRSFFANTDEIHEVNIRVSRNAIKVMADSPDKWRPQSHETADHSMPYAAAVVLLYGAIDDHYYEDPYLHDPRLLDLVSLVRCIPSMEADVHEKEYNLCDFEIVLKSGAQKSVRELLRDPPRKLPPSRRSIRRAHSEGCQACRLACAAVDCVRTGHQSQDRQGA
jgi:2-methylcitrate dehydratase